jgi:pyridoxal phosphate enzyme (YggS family)
VQGIAANLERVQAQIAAAAQRCGRDPAGIILVAVTKTQPLAAVQAAYRAGVRHFGENRVEEGGPKRAEFATWLAESGAGEAATWHMIGHVQHRKAGAALQFDLIHSVDSLRLAERLDRLAAPDARRVPVLLECNVSGEASKAGFAVSEWQRDHSVRSDFFATVRQIARLPHLCVEGLMTMAPIVAEAEETRPVFASLRALRDALRQEVPDVPWPHLSMGMTDDYPVAIEEGATLVRIGRAIFGERG